MKKKWIRLFSICERSWLEQELNKFIQEYDVIEIDIWNNENFWNAKVLYSYPTPPNYCEIESEENG